MEWRALIRLTLEKKEKRRAFENMSSRRTRPEDDVKITCPSESMESLRGVLSDARSGILKRKVDVFDKANKGVFHRAAADEVESSSRRKKKGRQREAMERKATLYDKITKGAADADDDGESSYLVNFEAKRAAESDATETAVAARLTAAADKEYQEVTDEFGRTVYVEVGSRQWCNWVASRGRDGMIAKIWENPEGGGSGEDDAPDGGGPCAHRASALTKEREKVELKQLEKETELAREAAKSRRLKGNAAGRGDGIRVYEPGVILPESTDAYNPMALAGNGTGLKKKESKKERLLRLKKSNA